MVEVPEARDEDRDSVARVLWKAFEKTASSEDYLKQEWIKLWNRPDKEDWAYVAVDGAKVVGNLSFFASENNIIRGKPVRFSGVWAVATDPAYRYQGVVKGMFKEALPRMNEEGIVLSILDPFYRPFYEKFGYALAEKRAKYVLPSDSLKDVTQSSVISAREVEYPQDVDAIIEIEKSMARFGSRFFHFRRTIDEMASGKEKGIFYILEKKSKPVGTVWFWYDTKPDGVQMSVAVTRYTTSEAIPVIIDLVKKHEVNIKKTIWYADLDVPIGHFTKKIHSVQSFQLGSMMMRVIDFQGYCQSISVPMSAVEPVILQLQDEYCSWNSGTFRVIPVKGTLKVETSDEPADISLDAQKLSEVIGGLSSAEMMRSFNEITCTNETARRLDAIFPVDNFVSYQRF